MEIERVLENITNSIQDLQSSDYNTYERPFKRLAQYLFSDEIRKITSELKGSVDLDDFIANANPGGSMVGSASLNWPTEQEKELGLTIAIIERGAKDTNWLIDFAHDYYYGGSTIMDSIHKFVDSAIIPFRRDFIDYLGHRLGVIEEPKNVVIGNNRVFIVHGHEEAPKEKIARFVDKLGLEPIILHEQASQGKTVIEKLITHSNVAFAIILLTADDFGRSKEDTEENPRARQNVILELGYFVGKLGRDRVMVLKKGNLEIPSDYLGVVYNELDVNGAWKQSLGRELESTGIQIDWNKVMKE